MAIENTASITPEIKRHGFPVNGSLDFIIPKDAKPEIPKTEPTRREIPLYVPPITPKRRVDPEPERKPAPLRPERVPVPV